MTIKVSGQRVMLNKINQFNELLCSCSGRYSCNPSLISNKCYVVAFEFDTNEDYESFWRGWETLTTEVSETIVHRSIFIKLVFNIKFIAKNLKSSIGFKNL